MVKVFSRHVKKCLIAGSLALTSLSPSVTHASMGEAEHDPRTLIFQQSHLSKKIFKYLTFEDFKETTPDGQSFLSFPNKDWMNCFFSVKEVQVNLNSDERAHEFFKQAGSVDPSINASIRLFTLIKKKIVALTSTLTWLNLSGNEIGDDGVEALAAGNWPNLWSLNLSNNKLGNKGIQVLAAGNWLELHSLYLSGNEMDVDSLGLLKKEKFPKLSDLFLSENLTEDHKSVETVLRKAFPGLSLK